MKAIRVFAAMGALFIAHSVNAEPLIYSAYIVIDKPDYSDSYAIGVGAYVVSDVPVTIVQVTHTPVDGASAGQWWLGDWYGTWWGWSPGRPLVSAGPLDGTVSIVATDELGAVSTAKEITIPPDAEIDFPSMQVRRTSRGYEVTANPVLGADYYYLWLWDPVDGFYPSSQGGTDPTAFTPIPTSNLVSGRSYSLFLIAVNELDVGEFRSYTLQSITHDGPELMLEQLGDAVAGIGPGKSLLRKVDSARKYYAGSDVSATCAALEDFGSEVESQRGKKLTIALADELSAVAAAIMGAIGCN